MNLAFFLGCNVPTQVYNYEISVRKIAEVFEIELIDILDFGCCGELTEPMDYYTSLVFSARNIALAEKEDLDILTLCNGCFCSLNKAISALRDPHLRSRVNGTLKKIGLSYQGKSSVFHFHQLMYDTIGPSRIKEKIVSNLNEVSVSCHNGCHILRPSDVLGFDDPEKPTKLEELVALTGVQIVNPIGIEQCCGSFLSLHDLDAAQSFAIESIERKGEVDAIVVGCPFCFKQFDIGQVVARRKFNKDLDIPILFYAELLGLALGFEAKDLGLNVIHKIRTNEFLGKLGVSNE
ncbi:MAG: CoB--CoM heterodisulfide reductase subunit B [Candidatus Korarchaeota archaeon]|nr:CoB--CoM heterodisulfide reductase subunit B [Candidatus Korarchaeota archaeon]